MIDLYIVADREVFADDEAYFAALAELASIVSRHERVALQVRAKGRGGDDRRIFVERARDVLGLGASNAFLNGSVDEAARAGFGGVHWPETEIPTAATSAGLRRGASVHSIAALRKAERAGASFALFGPVFDAGSKPAPGVGLKPLAAACAAATIPILAIGGVTPSRVGACVAAGAAGIAAVTGVVCTSDPAAAVAGYLQALRGANPTSTLQEVLQ